jgi:uncharacterized membrane protein
VFGLIYPPSLIVSAAVGGGIGALVGKLRDTGLGINTLNKVGTDLQEGKVALAILVKDANLAAVQQTMEGMSGKLTVQPLDEEAVRHLYLGDDKA